MNRCGIALSTRVFEVTGTKDQSKLVEYLHDDGETFLNIYKELSINSDSDFWDSPYDFKHHYDRRRTVSFYK